MNYEFYDGATIKIYGCKNLRNHFNYESLRQLFVPVYMGDGPTAQCVRLTFYIVISSRIPCGLRTPVWETRIEAIRFDDWFTTFQSYRCLVNFI